MEIELKAKIENLEMEETIKKRLNSIEFELRSKIKKRDRYYESPNEVHSDPDNFNVVRLRSERTNDKVENFFTFKNRKVVNGIEQNDEFETLIENPKAIERFFEEYDFRESYEKFKSVDKYTRIFENYMDKETYLDWISRDITKADSNIVYKCLKELKDKFTIEVDIVKIAGLSNKYVEIEIVTSDEKSSDTIPEFEKILLKYLGVPIENITSKTWKSLIEEDQAKNK